MEKIKIAVMGFENGHCYYLYKALQREPDVEIVAAAFAPRARIIYEKRLALQQVWTRTSSNGHDMLQALSDWCAQAEATGIKALQDFAAHLRTYSLQPSPTG